MEAPMLMKKSETKDVLDEFVSKAENVCEEKIQIWTEPKSKNSIKHYVFRRLN